MIIILIAIGVLFIFFPNFIFFVIGNIHHIIYWGLYDFIMYFKHKQYNVCPEYGYIRLNSASGSQVFGCGKTLLLVMRAKAIYKKYNDLDVWDNESNSFVKQHIHIISNVELYGIPYIKFESVNQLIDIDKFGFPDQDITIFLLDESGAVFNSRNYKNNISSEFLTRLLQSRKHKVVLYMTSQRFQFTDKILREVCSTVSMCKKKWRIVKEMRFDAHELEYCVNESLLKPKAVIYHFIFNSDYESYNSYQLVEDMRKNYVPGEYLSTEEILNNSGFGVSDPRLGSLNKRGKRRFNLHG